MVIGIGLPRKSKKNRWLLFKDLSPDDLVQVTTAFAIYTLRLIDQGDNIVHLVSQGPRFGKGVEVRIIAAISGLKVGNVLSVELVSRKELIHLSKIEKIKVNGKVHR